VGYIFQTRFDIQHNSLLTQQFRKQTVQHSEVKSLLELADVSEVRTAFIMGVMEAVRTSETSAYSKKTTRRYIPEGS
jgi:hypothetical protein